MKNRNIMIGLLAVAFIGAGGFLLFRNTSTNSSTEIIPDANNPSEENSESEQADSMDTSQAGDDTDEDPQAPVKGPAPAVSLDSAPVIFTGFGHSASRPLANGANTSTTCTTSAGIDCTLTFVNQSTDETVIFDTLITDAQGVARWEWVGGDKIGSGTWHITAQAGDKTSDVEVIYVQ